VIEVRGLSARLGSFELRDVTFTVPSGEYGVVIGPAGSGKTTLLETIAGILTQRAGTLALDGRDVAGVPPERRGIGFVYQRGFLFPHLSVEENVEYGAATPLAARDAASRLGANELYDRPVRSLSGGERQVVAIARALAAEPDLMVCDEITSALDVSVQAAIIDLLRELRTSMGLSLLFITHNLALIRTIADRVAVMTEGRIVELGPTAQVLERPEAPYTQQLLANTPVIAAAA
jgi:peptide/nickel transport system ATP-binding protein